MLVLSRKVDEQIVIGDDIRVTVVSIRGNQVRLGFEAPPSVPIFREELHHNVAPRRFNADSACAVAHESEHPSTVLVGIREELAGS